jgi:hypothetical protein
MYSANSVRLKALIHLAVQAVDLGRTAGTGNAGGGVGNDA